MPQQTQTLSGRHGARGAAGHLGIPRTRRGYGCATALTVPSMATVARGRRRQGLRCPRTAPSGLTLGQADVPLADPAQCDAPPTLVIIMAASLSSAGGASLVAVWNLPQAVWALLTCCKSCDEEERRLSLQRRSSGRPTSSSQRLLAGPAAPGQWDDLEAAAANRAAAARVILNT
eukprot:COSAG01_NODE_29024_length_647_cov_1.034672_1_plen_174_part_10